MDKLNSNSNKNNEFTVYIWRINSVILIVLNFDLVFHQQQFQLITTAVRKVYQVPMIIFFSITQLNY